MFSRISAVYLPAALLFASCKPQPIDIKVPQKQETITVSSVALNDHAVVVAAGYSVNSLVNLEDSLDSVEQRRNLPRALLIDSAIVTIAEAGQAPQNLIKIAPGMYGSNNMNFKEGTHYTLSVADHKKNIIVTSETVFMSKPDIGEIYPEKIINGNDTVVKLHVRLINVNATDNYFISYTSAREMVSKIRFTADNMADIPAFKPKDFELIKAGNAVNGVIEHEFMLSVLPDDTLVLTIGKIDNGYCKFLDAYKRTGHIINQLTGEPINLPTNINNGFGYFSLYRQEKRLFDLKSI